MQSALILLLLFALLLLDATLITILVIALKLLRSPAVAKIGTRRFWRWVGLEQINEDDAPNRPPRF